MKTTLTALLLLAFAIVASPAAGQNPAKKPDAVSAKDRDRAIAKALDYLNGKLFKMTDAKGTPKKPFTYAVAGLDYLLAGKTRTGKDPIPGILGYLEGFVESTERRYGDPKQLLDAHRADSEYVCQVNWPLAQTAVFLVELDARGLHRGRARRLLGRIVPLLAAAQEPDGGWGHEKLLPAKEKTEPSRPGRIVLSGYPRTLISSTNVVAASLGIVRTWFPKRAPKGLDRAVGHYRNARLSDGNFPYDIRQNAANLTGAGRTAGALVAMYWLGVPTADEDFRGSAKFVLENLEMIAEGHGSPALNVLNGAFAMRILGKDEFRRFRAEYFPRILAAQDPDGSFSCICKGKLFGVTCDSEPLLPGSSFAQDGKTYVTALHLFALLLDRSKLSLLGKKPPRARVRGETTPRRK
jgi:hypothetical protein